ncbi:hypothetical protein HNP93_000970 [Methanococcus maripaludis]|uniref:Uncharacterized protein n=2 Tax=Methanococcus maripaludis TaxID=39152 RepID=A0A7J9PA47_METMI|nr:hypothetical protein [Methanococcus maripaludis]MBA2858269.1 hypothetical protein [Methanococcus maripaludis]
MGLNDDKGKINSSSSIKEADDGMEECQIITTFKVPAGALDNRDLVNLEKDHRVGTQIYLNNKSFNLGGK